MEMKTLDEMAHENVQRQFKDNPHRGIILGLKGDTVFDEVGAFIEGSMIQISYIMGRSPNSQNRVYVVTENGILKTEPADASKVEDPSLIIYNAMRSKENAHVVSNGDQTDSIIDFDRHTYVLDFFESLSHRHCEPDPSNFTARISGCQFVYGPQNREVILSVLKAEPFAKERWVNTVKESGLTVDNFKTENKTAKEAMDAFNEEISRRSGLDYKAFPTIRDQFRRHVKPGFGYILTTYMPGSKELPPFAGEPLLVPIRGTLEEAMQFFWNALEPEWRVSLGGREITANGVRYAEPINKFEKVV